jgi:hypothetical protein
MSASASTLLAFLGLLGGSLLTSTATRIDQGELPKVHADATEERAAAARYISNLNTVVATRIVPDLQGGILSTAASRPRALTVEVTDDPSPYNVGVRVGADGSLTVRLSLGYLTMHDAALDAAGVAAALNRARELRQYLTYQVRIAHSNHARRARHEPTERAKTFAEVAGLDPRSVQALFAQPDWKGQRDRVQIDSLGWAVAYFLIRADPRLAGMPQSATTSRAEGAARLAAASSWFPVPPFATAFGLSAIEGTAASPPNERALLCHAAQLMEAGLAVTRANTQWRSRVKQEASAQSELAEIRKQIDRMRRDGRCATDLVTAWSANRHSVSPFSRHSSKAGIDAAPSQYRNACILGRIPS